MQVIDEVSRKAVDFSKSIRAIVSHTPDLTVYGYFQDTKDIKTIGVYTGEAFPFRFKNVYIKNANLCYSNKGGFWFDKTGVPEDIVINEVCTFGQGKFPYNFERRYEAIESFRLFEGRQIVSKKEFTLSKYLKYSFGLEFETSMGYVPEELCFRDGLIPLRDGSIDGIEYSSVVLRGSEGLALLEQEVTTLNEYTVFNKECSLHIHFGGYPLDPQKLYDLYYLCKLLEKDIVDLVPQYTFNSARYKNNGKDYCNPLKNFRDFNQMYEYLVGKKFFGDLTQPHPNDIGRNRKWQVHTRYFWCNFINAICYTVNKTIEFRLLRPTYNLNKIILWIYIFNAILKFAEETPYKKLPNNNLVGIVTEIYPKEVADRVLDGINRLCILKRNQTNNRDYIGNDLRFEEILFSKNFIIN